MILLRGNINIRIGKREYGSIKHVNIVDSLSVKKHNDVSPQFASALAVTYLIGNTPSGFVAQQYGYSLVQSQYQFPSGIAIVFLNNGAVVNQISATASGFQDNLTNVHTTSVTFNASDSTPSQYTFNQLALYTTVAGSLYMLIATVTLNSPLTKSSSDVVAVTWTESITTSAPFVNQPNALLSQCQASCTGTCNLQNTLSSYDVATCPGSFVNALWTLLIVPNVCTLLGNSPLSCYLSNFCKSPPAVFSSALIEAVLLDACGNAVGQYQPFSGFAGSELSEGANNIYLAYNFYANTTGVPAYVILLNTFGGAGAVFLSAGYKISGTTVQGLNQIGLALKVPYGKTTLQSLNTSQG